MAKKYVIELETKADGTIGALNDVAKSLESVANAEQKVSNQTQNVADQLKKLKEQLSATDTKSDQYKELSEQYKQLGGNIADLVPKTQNLKQEQRELKVALLAGQEALGTEKYTALTARLGEVNDQLKDIAESAGQNAGPPLENLSNISAGLQDRLKNLDFEGLNQDIVNVAGNISKFSFKGVIDGVKGLKVGFQSLGKALLANPIFAIAAALIAIALAAKAFIDSQREDVDKLNEAQKKATERRKDEERIAYAQAAGDQKKLLQLKLDSNKKDLDDTKANINRLVNLQRSYVGLSEDQEKELADLRDKYRSQEIDREVIKIEALNALNAKRLDIEEDFLLLGLNDRQKQEALLTREYVKQQEELKKLGGTVEDFDKLGEIFVDKLDKLKQGFKEQDQAAAKSAADAAKSKRDQITEAQKAVTDAIAQNQKALDDINKTAQQKELDAAAEKYKLLIDQAKKAGVDTKQIVELQAKEEQTIRDRYLKEEQKLVEQAKADQQALLQTLIDENLSAGRSARQVELDELAEQYFAKITILEREGQDASKLKLEYEKKRKEITNKYAQEEVEKEKERQQAVLTAQNAGLSARQQQLNSDLAALKLDYEARIALAKKFGEDATALEEEYANKQKELRIKAALEVTEQWLKSASDVLATFTSLNERTAEQLATKLRDLDKKIEGARTAQQRADLIKRRAVIEAEQKKTFEKNKKLQIAAAIVNTAANAVAAFGSQLVVGDITSPIRGGIAAAAAVAAGAVQIAKIKSTQFESTQAPESVNIPDVSGGGGGEGESTTPGFNPLVLDFLNNRPDQETPRAYVLAGDVEKATQARDRVAELARL